MFLKAVKGGHLNSRTPNTSTKLSINLVDSLSLNFHDCSAEMLYTLTKNFCVYTSFNLVCRFLDKIKNLKQIPGDSCVLILSLMLKLCST